MNTQELINALNKDFPGSVMKEAANVEAIPTGCIALDAAIGVGGIPIKKITEYFGGESSSKTTIALQTVASCQALGKNVVYIDAEHALDIEYAKNLGVDVDKLIIIQPDYAEDALNIIYKLLQKYSDGLGLIVLDSVAAMVPKAEADSEIGDAIVGLHAKLLTSFIRRITPVLDKSDSALILINQQRASIGGMTSFAGPSKSTPGGHALKHGASVRIEFARTANITVKEDVVGIKVSAQTRKNKVAPPFVKALFDVDFGRGTWLPKQILNHAIELGLVKKAGSWYKYKDNNIGQGQEQAIENLLVNQQMNELLDAVCEHFNLTDKNKQVYRKQLERAYAISLSNSTEQL